MRLWEASDLRTQFINELDTLATDEPEMEYVMGVPLIHSLFDVPSPFGGRFSAAPRPPSKWKTNAMITFALLLRYACD